MALKTAPRFVHVLLVTAGCTVLVNWSPPATARPESKPGAASSSPRASVPDAGAPAIVNGASGPKASPHPPKLPRSPRRACSKDSDCAIVPPRPCMCQECGVSWREVLNKRALNKLQASWATERCVQQECPTCESRLLGTKAICHAGQCAVK
jgi:hypothetical protein